MNFVLPPLDIYANVSKHTSTSSFAAIHEDDDDDDDAVDKVKLQIYVVSYHQDSTTYEYSLSFSKEKLFFIYFFHSRWS